MHKPTWKMMAVVLAAAGLSGIWNSYGAAKMETGLTAQQQQMARVAAYAATGAQTLLAQALEKGLDEGLTVNQAKEILVQLYAYAGFPRSLNALGTLMTVVEARRAKGLDDAMGGEGKPLPPETDKWAYGNQVQIELTGAEVKGGVMDFAPAIDTFLKEHLFADIFGRGVLTHAEREIATIAALSAMKGGDSQLQSHIRIGRNVGLNQRQLDEIAAIVAAAAAPDFAPPFARGVPNPYGAYFTGRTYLVMLSEKDDLFNTPIGHVTFGPGARTHWHTHSGGQILLVTGGTGRYQARGGEIQILREGDVVKIPPDADHWHGAAPDAWFSHLALETNARDNQTTWLEPVTDEQYR